MNINKFLVDKKNITREDILAYSNFTKTFVISNNTRNK